MNNLLEDHGKKITSRDETSNSSIRSSSSEQPATIVSSTLQSDVGIEKEMQEYMTQHKDENENNISSSLGKRRSTVWKYFTIIEKTDGSKPTHAKCIFCPSTISCDPKNGTSALMRHRCPKHPLTILERKDKRQKILSFSGGSNDLGTRKFDKEFCRQELAKMIIMHEMPFSIIEYPGFIRFCRAMQPQFHLVSRTTITKDCLKIYFEEKAKLREELLGVSRISLTTDLWTSIQNASYMCLTAHYVDKDWVLKKRIINFCILPTPHTGEAIGQALEECLVSWGIEKLCCLSMDNASNSDAAVKLLIRRFYAKKNSLLLGGKYFHLRCAAHILNLIVKDGIDEIKTSIASIRNSVSYVRTSPSRFQIFKKCVELENIKSKKSVCLDCPTRWNSTYFMLDAAINHQRAFERLEEVDLAYAKRDFNGIGLPTEYDWSQARIFASFLKDFHEMTNQLSGSKYPTSNLFFHCLGAIELRIKTGERSLDSSLHNMALKMRGKYNKYWGGFEKINIMLIVSVILDPCWKLELVKYYYKELYGDDLSERMVCTVKEVINALIVQYNSECDSSTTLSCNEDEDRGNNTGVNGDGLLGFMKQRFKKRLIKDGIQREKSELDRYLDDPFENEEGFVILDWWKRNSTTYPILSMIARDVLAIPTTTVASESAFSTGGRVLDKFRSSLSPSTVEALVCAQDWLRSDCAPVNIEEVFEDLEKIEESVSAELNEEMKHLTNANSHIVAASTSTRFASAAVVGGHVTGSGSIAGLST